MNLELEVLILDPWHDGAEELVKSMAEGENEDLRFRHLMHASGADPMG